MDDYQAELTYHAVCPVCFTRGVFSRDNPTVAALCAAARPALFFIEDALAAAYPALRGQIEDYFSFHNLTLAGKPQCRPGGEKCKDGLDAVLPLLDAIADAGLDRHSLVFAIGGGAFLDAVGFAAALAHRGIRLVRLPSTALSQADSGVGVKNGVNYHGQKNYLGTFAAPHAIISDFEFLEKLPTPLRLDGAAEAFKVAIIKDADFFAYMEAHIPEIAAGGLPPLEEAIKRSARLHSEHIRDNGDPFEMGCARPLDFGHWSAHWLEAASGYRVRHGEGVAMGIALDSIIARNLGILPSADCARIIRALQAGGFSLYHPLFADTDAMSAGMEQFRQHLGGELCLTMPTQIGRKTEIHELGKEEIARAAEELRETAKD